MKIVCLNLKCPSCKLCGLFISDAQPKFPVRYLNFEVAEYDRCINFIKLGDRK